MGPEIQLSDFAGEHGPYQLALTVFLFVRYVFLGLMANSGPLMTPDVTFYCSLPMDEVEALMPNITMLNKTEQDIEMREEFKRICQLDLHLYQQAYLNSSASLGGKLSGRKFNATNRIRECTEFTYDIAPDQGKTMTSEFDLVCERDWLRSLFQSLISAAIVVAHVFWGTFSDKYGRLRAQKICLIVSLISGSLSIFAADFWTFVLARALCSFGDLGLVVSLTTTVVELVGNQYRGMSVAIVNFGYALGVTMLPYIVAYFEDFRYVISFTVFCHLVTMPFIFTTNESVRWQLTNRKFNSAKRELKRIARWNRSSILNRVFVSQTLAKKLPSESGAGISFSEEFDLIFNKFVDQIETRNLCDPLGPSNPIDSVTPTETSIDHTAIREADESGPLDENKPWVGHERSASACQLASKLAARLEMGDPTETRAPMFEAKVWPPQAKRSGSCSQLDNSVEPKTSSLPTGDKYRTLPLISLPMEDSQQVRMVSGFEPRDALVRGPAQQPDCINLVTSQLSFVGRVSRLFGDKQLMIAVFTIVWTTFNSELQYTSYIIINLEVGEDVYLNYILGGCMEALAAITASLLLSYAPRRHSLITFWLLISLSCFGLSVAHIDSTWAVWLLALAKFSQSCLSSIASVAAYESFPTFLRQSGSGLVFTLGMLGSVFAPLIFAEFDDHAGMDRVLMTFSISSLIAAILIFLFLKETRNCELQ